jgi:hypothetical protein
MKSDLAYLHHILDSIDRIEKYMSGECKEGFLKNELLQDGVIRQLTIIGEASRRISSISMILVNPRLFPVQGTIFAEWSGFLDSED